MLLHFVDTEPASQARFREMLSEHEFHFRRTLEEVPGDAEILSIQFTQTIDADFLRAHPKLRFIATRCSGLDHIDFQACQKARVTVSSVPSYGENTVAEHTFALTLTLSRRLREVAGSKRIGQFSFEKMRGFDLRGRTMGVIGTGRIGTHVIRLAKAFGMHVVAFDHQPSPMIASLLEFDYAPLEEVLSRAHVLSLHVPLTALTVHLLNRETLAKCRPGVLIINTARGGLIETEALLEALDSGHVAGAGLDVLEDERVFRKDASGVIADEIIRALQSKSSPEERHQREPARLEKIRELTRNEALLAREDVVFTPHIAFNSVEAVQRIDEVTVENIRGFLEGKPRNVVTG